MHRSLFDPEWCFGCFVFSQDGPALLGRELLAALCVIGWSILIMGIAIGILGSIRQLRRLPTPFSLSFIPRRKLVSTVSVVQKPLSSSLPP